MLTGYELARDVVRSHPLGVPADFVLQQLCGVSALLEALARGALEGRYPGPLAARIHK